MYLLCSHGGVELLKLPQTEFVVLILVEQLKDDGCLLLRHGKLGLQHVQGVRLLQALHEVLHVLAEDLPHVLPETGTTKRGRLSYGYGQKWGWRKMVITEKK